jgi:CO/xanthine dehydrogenase Mo-binding subunit
LEPHTSAAYIDERNRLVIISATQVPFHVRRIVSNVLEIPLRKIRVIKPRIGGGFGGKQEILLEPIVAMVTMETRRPSRCTMTRKEVFISSRTRHPFRAKLKMGYNSDGEITAIDYDAVLNTGAYGTHGLTVLSNVGAKILPFFNKVKNVKFLGRTVYTNLPVAGAYRGYGATQSGFAFAQHIDIIARDLGVDILEYWKQIHIREGETSPVFKALGEGTEGVETFINSCSLDGCIDLGAKEIDWYAKRGKKINVGESKIKGVGVACSMQGSAIPEIDMGSAYIKMNEDGSFNLHVGATDIGTGSDTILAQIAAEEIGCHAEDFIVLSSDTDLTPFDVGAYASSTTYLSGEAVRKTARQIKEQILKVAAEILDVQPLDLEIEASFIYNKDKKEVHISKVCQHAMYTNNQFQIQATASHITHISPPPFIAQFAEVNVDVETGEIELVKFVSAVDCGQAINPVLVEGQVEGATVNGISYALDEEYRFNKNGVMTNASFGKYKIFTAKDLPELKTIIVPSHEDTGPFGAKSVAEVGINGPMPAIANAIYDAVGVRIFDAPLKAEKIFEGLNSNHER